MKPIVNRKSLPVFPVPKNPRNKKYFLSLSALNKNGSSFQIQFYNLMNMKYFYILLLFCCGIMTFHSCQNKTENHRIVTVSILPQKYLVEKIAGDYLQINVMVPPGMNPATCDLSTGQLRKLYDSDLCFTIGYLPFELTHLYPVLENQKNIRVINHSEGLKLLGGSCSHALSEGHSHGGVDPHIWLSPANARQMASTIYQVLAERYPEQQQQFKKNQDSLLMEIDETARHAEEVFKDRRQRIFLIYHPALTYFAADYGLEQVAIEEEGKDPHPVHLKKIIDLAKEKNIHLIFIQQQFDTTNAESIAREINGQVIKIDPLAENWKAEMEKLIGIFRAEKRE